MKGTIKMVEVIAILNVRSECAAEAEKCLLPLIEGSRMDAGNIFYHCNAVEGKAGSWIFHEQWENQEVLDSHMKQPHFVAFGDAIAPMIVGDLQVFVLGKPVA
jgi:quinol monooxygenase YgiN